MATQLPTRPTVPSPPLMAADGGLVDSGHEGTVVCITPIRLKDQLLVPCGKCINCRKARAHEWAQRMGHEADQHEGNLFCTLTYSDEQLPPPGGCLVKKDLQDFLKRLRKRIAPRRIKYYAAGEYGGIYHRPHYHLILFNLYLWEHIRTPANRGWQIHGGPLWEAWHHMGFIQADRFTPQTARYVSNYLLNKAFHKRSAYGQLHPFNIQPPFQTQSQGLGRAWAEARAADLYEHTGIRQGREILPMPRYYQKILKETYDETDITNRLLAAAKDKRAIEEATRAAKGEPRDQIFSYHQRDSMQKARNHIAKDDIQRRKR